MQRENCWEVKKCGREPGGENVKILGICPAVLPSEYDGVNNGKQAGRFCWTVAGTLCQGEVQGTYATELRDCLACEFLGQVSKYEGRTFTLSPPKSKR